MQTYVPSFDATQFDPVQGVGGHPKGIFDAQISNTSKEPTKDGQGGMFNVEFTTPAGKIIKRYQLWNNNPQTVEIAHKQLSALCHAVAIYKLDFNNDGAVLRGARLQIDVQDQIDKETKQPNGYVEIKRVLDTRGNEPGRVNAAPQPQQAAPMTQQAGGAWGSQAPAQAPQQAAPAQPQPVQQTTGGGWQPGQQPAPAANKPPWAS